MKNDLFSYRDYKAYLLDFLRSQPKEGHGFRSKLAKAMGCKLSYLSQVLHQAAHLSLEQGEALNDLLLHKPDESDFFLLLVQFGRAGTHKLRQRLQHQIDVTLEKRSALKNRIELRENIDPLDQQTYYSSWMYAAVHILLTIPEYRTIPAIAKRLSLHGAKVEQVLDFLLKTGLAEYDNGRYATGKKRLFLPSDSPLISKHHSNWRVRALDGMDFRSQRDLHITSVMSLAREDFPKVRERLLKAFEEVREIVKPSKEEELICLCLDFLQV